MDEMIAVLKDIRDFLAHLNSNVEMLNVNMEQFNRKLDDIKGFGIFSSLSDLYDKMDEIQTDINTITSSGLYTFQDVCNKLDSTK